MRLGAPNSIFGENSRNDAPSGETLPAAESQTINEQGAVLFFNEEERVWELVTMDVDTPPRVWDAEADALRDPAADGWEIEGPFRMCPQVAGLPKVWFVGYGLTRRIQ